MRALFVIRADFERNLGGDSIQLLETKTALERMGVAVEVRAATALGDVPRCDVAHVFNLQTVESSAAAFDALARAGMPAVLSPIYWDMVDHWFALATTARAHWRWCARLLGRRRARAVYRGWRRRRDPGTREWRVQREILQAAAHVLPNAHGEAELLVRRFALDGAFREKIAVVPNGVDPARFADAGVLPAPAVVAGLRDFVLQVGTLSPVKNQLGLLDALDDLPVPIVCAGPAAEGWADYAARCRARAAARGNVVFVDRLPHGELPGLYARAAVHVLPSWRETPGLASLEAAAAGCRVVTTSIGSAHEYFGDLAWYCRPDDPASIRAAVEAALQAPRTPALRERVLREFTWTRAAEATLAAYRAVLASTRARA